MIYTILIFLCFTIQSFGQWERSSVGRKFYSNFENQKRIRGYQIDHQISNEEPKSKCHDCQCKEENKQNSVKEYEPRTKSYEQDVYHQDKIHIHQDQDQNQHQNQYQNQHQDHEQHGHQEQHDQEEDKSNQYSKQEVLTREAPLPIGPFSQAIIAPEGTTVYLSGQIGLDPNKEFIVDDFETQAIQAFLNIKTIAEAAGGSLDNIVKLTVFLTDFKDYQLLNQIESKFFKKPYPARSTVAVASLAQPEIRIEVEAIMVLPKKVTNKY